MKITIRELEKSYAGQSVLEKLNADILLGGRYAIMGRSGCGKTTLLRILMGLEVPDGGKVEGLQGLRISAVFQQARLCPALTALENVLLAAEKSSAAKQQAELFLARLGLDEIARKKRVSKLSGGQQQRVAIARALIAPFDLLILDEAFKGLDTATRADAAALVDECLQGRTLVAVTHDAAELPLLKAQLLPLFGSGLQGD